MVLEAGERNRAILEQKIDDLRVDVSELQQYYRANRMQQDTTELCANRSKVWRRESRYCKPESVEGMRRRMGESIDFVRQLKNRCRCTE